MAAAHHIDGAADARATGTDDRLRKIETFAAVHEAVCAERYRAIGLKLNVAIGLLVMLLGAAAAGNPVLAALNRVFGH